MSEPKHVSENTFMVTPQEAAAATSRACAAFVTVRDAVRLQTHQDGGSDPVAAAAVAANARLAMFAGGSYLLARLDPATPRALASAIRAFAEVLEDIAMNSLAGIGNDDPNQAARLREADVLSGRVAAFCN